MLNDRVIYGDLPLHGPAQLPHPNASHTGQLAPVFSSSYASGSTPVPFRWRRLPLQGLPPFDLLPVPRRGHTATLLTDFVVRPPARRRPFVHVVVASSRRVVWRGAARRRVVCRGVVRRRSF